MRIGPGERGATISATIEKPEQRVTPNLPADPAAWEGFTWASAAAALDGLPAGGRNIAHEAVDRHAHGPRADHVALRSVDREGGVRELTYAELAEATARFANALRALGIGPGERVFVLCPRSPELHVAVLGALKARAVVSPLFAAFGPAPILQRMAIGEAAALVTTPALYGRKVAPIRDRLPTLRHVIAIGAAGAGDPGLLDLAELLAAADPVHEIEATDPEEPALLHFTSGTTGTPKGAVHVHEAVVAHHASARHALDLHPEDVFWCTADPGWVTGTSYGIVAPLTCGVTSILDEGEFDPGRWYGILAEQEVSVWYTAPTAVRMLMRAGGPGGLRPPALRFVASVGEPLGADAVRWGVEALGLPIHDNWWQTETGAIMIANTAAAPIAPGSMGRALPGVDAAILALGPDGEPQMRDGVPVTAADGAEGELALRRGWPSMFRGYLGQEERYRRAFVGDWYRTGDLASRDAEGRFWFVGRADDVIKSGGHLIGPFEVESALLDHPAVAEAAVVGLPDQTMGEVVTAYVVAAPGHPATRETERAIRAHARGRLGAAIAPRSIEFREALPHTRSGKIMRRLLRARALGLPEGDVSTLEAGT